PEKGRIEIGVKESLATQEVSIYVQDSGIGIPQESQSKIFNKFEQVPTARQNVKGPKGTGLGLSICRAMVELHGGKITVESTLGEGTRFTITLPFADDRVPA